MALTHWWPIYLGVAAATLPVVVHWLTRPRPVKLPTSTLRFVREAVEQRRARHRLRDFIVLALRTAAVLLLGWAVARPLVGTLSVVSDSGGEVARVVLLDTSQSMAAVDRGAPAFEIARSRAAGYLAYRPGLRANLILAAASARSTFDEVSANLEVLHDVLAGSQVEPERLNVEPALAAAGRMLAAARSGSDLERELVVVSDFQRTNWAAADFSMLPEGTRIQLESVAPAAPPRNLAVLRAGVSGRPSQDQPVRVEVEIGNYSNVAERVRCDVAVGQTAFRLEGLCPANGKLRLSEDAALTTTGWQSGEARLVEVDDALQADNVRHFTIEVLPPPVYALISRQSPGDSEASSFYVARALAPYGNRRQTGGVRVVHVDPTAVDADSLAGCELMILDHPGKLSDVSIGLLAGLLRRGRAVLFVASETIDAVTLRQLAEAAGTGLQMPVEFQPPEASRPRHDLFLARLDRQRPPFDILGDSVTSAVGSLRFGGGLASRPLEGALADDLVAEFNDRSAALVVSSCGAGALGVLNADLTQSNLPASPLFVPLVGELVDRLLSQRGQAAENRCGEPLAVYLPANVGTVAGLTTVAPDQQTRTPPGEFAAESAGIVWRVPAAPPPGVYRLKRDGQDVFALATAIAPEESDLRYLGPEVLKDRLAGGRAVTYRAATDNDSQIDSLWTWLAVAAVVCMLVELTALRMFRT